MTSQETKIHIWWVELAGNWMRFSFHEMELIFFFNHLSFLTLVCMILGELFTKKICLISRAVLILFDEIT